MPSATASRNDTEQRCPGDLQPARVRGLDRRAERLAADVRVGLEPGHAFVGPVVHDALRLFGGADLRHRRGAARAGEVRAREVHSRAGNLAAVDAASSC